MEPLRLTPAEQAKLEHLAADDAAGHKVRQRARIILAAASGLTNTQISRSVGASRPVVIKWREQFRCAAGERFSVLVADANEVRNRQQEIAKTALQEIETMGAETSLRELSRKIGVPRSTVQRALASRVVDRQLGVGDLPLDEGYSIDDVLGVFVSASVRAVAFSAVSNLNERQPAPGHLRAAEDRAIRFASLLLDAECRTAELGAGDILQFLRSVRKYQPQVPVHVILAATAVEQQHVSMAFDWAHADGSCSVELAQVAEDFLPWISRVLTAMKTAARRATWSTFNCVRFLPERIFAHGGPVSLVLRAALS